MNGPRPSTSRPSRAPAHTTPTRRCSGSAQCTLCAGEPLRVGGHLPRGRQDRGRGQGRHARRERGARGARRHMGQWARRVGNGASEATWARQQDGVFQGLDFLLRNYTEGVPAALPPALVPQIKSYLSTSDIPLLSQALSLLALLFELAPMTTFPEIESDLLPDVYRIAHSPLVSGAALDSLLSFCSALVSADNQIATHLVPNLVIAVEKAPHADASPNNVAKAVAQIGASRSLPRA
ncbi:hypothetical protein K438DRAFT_813829 [Mycena galopus ATCC 62051]|nr:hypothetical protein K438DRAFT_813829 [Mycena galopus ATCC 62051]